MACVMKRLKLESAGTAKQKPLTFEPMFLLPRRFGLMFLAWLAARSGLTAQCLCLFAAVFQIHQGENSHWPWPERPHGEFQLLQGLAGVWPSWVVMSTSSVGIFDLAKKTNPVFRRSHIFVALVFTLSSACRTLRTCLLEPYHTAIPL